MMNHVGAPETIFYVSLYVGWLVSINRSINFYIYACRSTEYHTAFKSILAKCGFKNYVADVTVLTATGVKHTGLKPV